MELTASADILLLAFDVLVSPIFLIIFFNVSILFPIFLPVDSILLFLESLGELSYDGLILVLKLFMRAAYRTGILAALTGLKPRNDKTGVGL